MMASINEITKMRITTPQLRRIIKEVSDLLRENNIPRASTEIIDLASRPEGVSLEEINDPFGPMGFDIIDELTEDNILWLDDAEGVVYAAGSQPSSGLAAAVDRYTSR